MAKKERVITGVMIMRIVASFAVITQIIEIVPRFIRTGEFEPDWIFLLITVVGVYFAFFDKKGILKKIEAEVEGEIETDES